MTKDCETGTPNVGVYRLQLQSHNTMTVHWLSVRGGRASPAKSGTNGQKIRNSHRFRGRSFLIIVAAATPIPVDSQNGCLRDCTAVPGYS
ncbi:MAG UNVERIFIED_CONTAM: UbiD family decarboxylase [Microcystis novacekii LVE1205-3]